MTNVNEAGVAKQGKLPAARSPMQIVEALGLGSVVGLEAMASRKCAFKAVHMGEHDLAIGTLLDLITSDAALCPPRTGHIGNWGNIARGRAGAMDFNKAICAPGYGYPLLYCFTQTEADAQTRQGDWGYLPGSFVDGDARTPLRLHGWNGTEFVPCTHAVPRFTPFMQAELDGELKPLTEVHRRRLDQIGPHSFKLEQALFADSEAAIRPLLTALIDEARRRDNPRRALHDLISHSVALDGTMARCELELDGKGFKLGKTYYPSTEALVEHALVPFRAVARPWQFMAEIGHLPWQLPVASNILIAVLSAVLETHLPGGILHSSRMVGPLNPHLHWGGRDMAGYPPRNRGYLLEEAKARSMKRICATLVEHFPTVQPLCFVLLPSTAFMLCPTTAHPGDAELLSKLFRRVREAVSGGDASGPNAQQAIGNVVRSWHDADRTRLSTYFRNRFGPRRGGLLSGDMVDSHPVEPDGFRDLTVRQASMIVGAFYEITSAEWTTL